MPIASGKRLISIALASGAVCAAHRHTVPAQVCCFTPSTPILSGLTRLGSAIGWGSRMPQAPPVRQHRLVFVGLLAAACCSLPQSCSLHAHSRSFPLACRMQARCSSSKCLALVVAGREGNGACVESAIVWRGAPVCACTCDGRLRPGCLCRPGRLRVQRCPTVGAHPAS